MIWVCEVYGFDSLGIFKGLIVDTMAGDLISGSVLFSGHDFFICLSRDPFWI